MKTRRLLMSLLVLGTLSVFAMTDQQVIDYIKKQTAAGKTEQQIGKELLAMGVTPEQAKRIKADYEASQISETNVTTLTVNDTRNERRHDPSTDISTTSFDAIGRELNPDENDKNTPSREIYGHAVFNSEALTFEPSDNLATPQNYRLGPGDEVIIDIWGNSEDHLRQTISPEGSIMISQLGPVYLNGKTIQEASKHIKNAFSSKYAGISFRFSSEKANLYVSMAFRIILILSLGICSPYIHLMAASEQATKSVAISWFNRFRIS